MTTTTAKAADSSLRISNCEALIDGSITSHCDIHIVDGVITEVIEQGSAEPGSSGPPAGTVIDGSGLVAMPGLINGHTHAAMTLLRGAAEDVPVEAWFNDHIWPIEVNVTGDDVYLGTKLACAEMIRAGVTTFVDHYFHEDRAAEAVAESGLRANLGMTFFSSQGPAGLEASVRFVEDWHGAVDGRITASLAPHATYTCNDDDLREAGEAARRLGVPVHLHAAEDLNQTISTRNERGLTPIEVLAETGLLDGRVLVAHGCGIVESDLAVLAPHAERVGVAHCPKTYMKLAINPLTPIRELLDIGVAVGLGTDGPASCNSIDLFENMRLTALTQKYSRSEATWLTVDKALEMAGPLSARLIGQDIGRLSPGAKADVILVDLSGPHCLPVHDPLAALVYSVRADDVRTTIVDGIPLMVDRELLTIDMGELRSQVEGRAPELLNFDPNRSIQTY